MRRVLAVTAALTAAALLSACGGGSADPAPEETTDTPAIETITPGTLSVGTVAGIPPLVAVVDGEWEGFDVDMVNTIAEHIGIENVEWTSQDFSTLLTAVAAGRYDLNASGTTGWAPEGSLSTDAVKEREQIVAFSRPYFIQRFVYTSRSDHPIETTDDLGEGDRVGVFAGTLQQNWASEELAARGIEVVTYNSNTAAFTALDGGQLEAVIESDVTVAEALGQFPNLQMSDASIEALDSGYAFAFPKNDRGDALRAAFDKAIGEMEENGEYAAIHERWFPDRPVQPLP